MSELSWADRLNTAEDARVLAEATDERDRLRDYVATVDAILARPGDQTDVLRRLAATRQDGTLNLDLDRIEAGSTVYTLTDGTLSVYTVVRINRRSITLTDGDRTFRTTARRITGLAEWI